METLFKINFHFVYIFLLYIKTYNTCGTFWLCFCHIWLRNAVYSLHVNILHYDRICLVARFEFLILFLKFSIFTKRN